MTGAAPWLAMVHDEEHMGIEISDSAVGRPAPVLKLPLAGGGEFSLESCLGRATLVIFLSHAA